MHGHRDAGGNLHIDCVGPPRPTMDELRERFSRLRTSADFLVDISATPNGCQRCGSLERGHGPDHGYIAPPDVLRLARMKARREARLNPPPRRPAPAATHMEIAVRTDDWTDSIRSALEALDQTRRPTRERRPPGTVPLILVDGPCAGQIHHIPESATAWNVADPYEATFTSSPIRWTATSTYTQYQVHRYTLCYPQGDATPHVLPLHLGVSGREEPDEAGLLRHVTPALDRLGWLNDDLRRWNSRRTPAGSQPDQPIRILDEGSETFSHDATIRLSTRTGGIQGICQCGWLTEEAPHRRGREVMDLADTHRMGANARSAARLLALRQDRIDAIVRGDVATDPELEAARNWPSGGSTCAHVCGPDPGHVCDARAATTLRHPLPSGGTRTLPLCRPCAEAETADGPVDLAPAAEPPPIVANAQRRIEDMWVETPVSRPPVDRLFVIAATRVQFTEWCYEIGISPRARRVVHVTDHRQVLGMPHGLRYLVLDWPTGPGFAAVAIRDALRSRDALGVSGEEYEAWRASVATVSGEHDG